MFGYPMNCDDTGQGCENVATPRNCNSGIRHGISVLILATTTAGIIGQSHAQGLKDPMRPADYTDPTGVPAGGQATSSGLQLIKTSKSGRYAVIDGQTVKVGQKVGDSTLISLSDTAAVMKDAEGQRVTLRMYPDSEKTVVGDKKPPRSAAPKQTAAPKPALQETK